MKEYLDKLRELELKINDQRKEIEVLQWQLTFVTENNKKIYEENRKLNEKLISFKNGVRNLLNKYMMGEEVL